MKMEWMLVLMLLGGLAVLHMLPTKLFPVPEMLPMKNMETPPVYMSLKTDIAEQLDTPVNSGMIKQQEDLKNKVELIGVHRNRKMYMQYPRSLFEAIRQVETGGEKNPAEAVGDGGLSIGPYQISKAYWQDAIMHHPEIGGSYQDCKKQHYSEWIMMSYWDRYAKPDCSLETLARIHNGGPKGHTKKATLKYWNKVEALLGSG